MAIILLFLVLNESIVADKVRVVLIVCLTCIYIFTAEREEKNESKTLYILSIPGKCSLSIFIWHQIILAFYRYIIISSMSGLHWIIYVILLFPVCSISYIFLEVKLGKVLKTKSANRIIIAVTAIICIIEVAVGGWLYLRAGVIRDIPELGISAENPHRGMHAEYVDRIYQYSSNFSNTGKKKVFIYGDSMGRDFGNILLESQYANDIEIYYIHPSQFVSEKHDSIMQDADLVFYATLGDAVPIPEDLMQVDTNKLYIVGIKNFGECNGNFYNRRFNSNYFDFTVKLGQSYVDGKSYYQQNEDQKTVYGDHYIDMISPLINENGEMPVFSDEKMYISADCEHLTRAGARYYARKLDLGWIVEE